jgi:hypothetical protein
VLTQSDALKRALDALNSICNSSETTTANSPKKPLLAAGISPHNPEAWRAPFKEWLDSQCTVHQRAFGGLTCLHIGFCEWEQAREGVPCTRETFEALLGEFDFLIGEVEGTLLVSGLIFKDDAELVS